MENTPLYCCRGVEGSLTHTIFGDDPAAMCLEIAEWFDAPFDAIEVEWYRLTPIKVEIETTYKVSE
jgi:hypothetical protein